MSIRCPYCSFAIDLKGARAGHFNPKCPRCAEKFDLVVHADASTPPTVKSLRQDNAGATLPPSQTAAPKAVPKKDEALASIEAALGLDDQATLPPTNTRANQRSVHGTRVTGAGATSHPPAHVSHAGHHDTIVKEIGPPDDRIPVGKRLGGYEVEKKLGQGGMGAVYLARQLSLDRDVALKTLAPHLADDPQFVGRFTREAYAAAQLCHHNIVQIHDIGADSGINFFSMEFVRGRHLGQLVDEHGPLDVETAVSHTLQAARGLKFAHEHGLIHRDIKPDNLLLNEQGVVKVADLGLVKKIETAKTQAAAAETALTLHPDGNIVATDASQTQLHISMGTPAYMPPEQAHDAASVDQRADVYSLGCSLYHLLTGRPPFSGRTALEVITKHSREKVTPPDEIVTDVPHALSPVVLKMLAKKPEQRYQTMAEVIEALEDFLGIKTAGPFTPKVEDLRTLEFSANAFHTSTWARFRPKVFVAFYALCVLLALVFNFGYADRPTLAWGLAGGMIGVAVLSTVAYQLTLGIGRRTPLYLKGRPFMLGAGVVDWLIAVAGIAVAGLLLYVFDLHWWWLIGAFVSVGLAQAIYWTVDRMAASDQRAYTARAEHLIKQLRLKGVDETTIKLFVCKFSGDYWEEFYEALFGYDEKIKARATWGNERGRERPRYGAWRDKLLAWLDRKLAERRALRDAKILARLEERMLAAKGINAAVAKKQAAKNAQRLVDRAESFRATVDRDTRRSMAKSVEEEKIEGKKEAKSQAAHAAQTADARTIAPEVTTRGGKKIVQSASSAILDDHPELEHDPNYVKESYFKRRYGTPLDFLLSPQLRLVVGVVLLACFALWWNQTQRAAAENEFRTLRAHRTDAAEIAARTAKKEGVTAFEAIKSDKRIEAPQGPINIVGTDKRLDARLGGFQSGLAGALLVLGALFFGRMLGLLMYASAATALVIPHLALPVVGQPEVWMVTCAALAVWLLGVLFFRTEPG